MKSNHVYKVFREMQEFFQSYNDMSPELYKDEDQSLTQNIEKKFFNTLIHYKSYYTKINFLNYFSNEKRFPYQKIKGMNDYKLDNTMKELPKFLKTNFSGTENCEILKIILKLDEKDCFNQVLINYITFNLIPSLYNMFIEKKYFLSFCKLIQKLSLYYNEHKIKTPLHILFSRSIFISPFFVNFLRKTFRQFFSTFSIGDKIDNYNNIKEKVEFLFKKNIQNLPSFIKEFIQLFDDKKNLLKETVFQPIFNQPEIYFIDYLKVESDAGREYYKTLLQNVFEDDLIDRLIQIIEKVDLDDQLFNEDKFTYPKEKVIDIIDVNAISMINSIIQNESNSINIFGQNEDIEYTIYKAHYNDDNEEEEDNSEIKIMDIKYRWLHFINFLICSPQLPVEADHLPNEIVTKEIFMDMIENYLIKPSESVELMESFEYFKESFISNKIFSSKYLFKKEMECSITRFKLPTFKTKLKQVAYENLGKIQNGFLFDSIETVFILVQIKLAPKIPELPEIPTNAKNIIKNREKYKNESNEYAKIMKKQDIFANIPSHIFKLYYFKNLSFKSYLNCRQDLSKYDEIIKHVLPHISTDSIKLESIIASKVLKKTDLFRDQCDKLYCFFENNSDPVTKYNDYIEFMSETKLLADNYFGEIGEDDFAPILIVLIYLTNPPHFIPNIFYLYEYIPDLSINYGRLGFFLYLTKEKEFANYNLPDFNSMIQDLN